MSVSDLLALGRRVQAGKLPEPEIERLYLSPANRALVLSALWAMADSDKDIALGRRNIAMAHKYQDECVALEDAAAAARMAQNAWSELERVG